MKFAKYLAKAMAVSDPEWTPYWINYKHLKKVLKLASVAGNTATAAAVKADSEAAPVLASVSLFTKAAPNAVRIAADGEATEIGTGDNKLGRAQNDSFASNDITSSSDNSRTTTTTTTRTNRVLKHDHSEHEERDARVSTRPTSNEAISRPWMKIRVWKRQESTTNSQTTIASPTAPTGERLQQPFDEAAASVDDTASRKRRRPSYRDSIDANGRGDAGAATGKGKARGFGGSQDDQRNGAASTAAAAPRRQTAAEDAGWTGRGSVGMSVSTLDARSEEFIDVGDKAIDGSKGRVEEGNGVGGGGKELQEAWEIRCPFFRSLIRQVEKCTVFFLQKEEELKVRIQRLQLALSHLKDPELSRLSSVKEAHVKLMQACVNFYRDALLLEDFAMVNYTAVIKLLKKRDKIAGTADKSLFITEVMTGQPFAMYLEVASRVAQVEGIFREIEDMCFLKTAEGMKSVMRTEFTVVEAIMQLSQDSEAAQAGELRPLETSRKKSGLDSVLSSSDGSGNGRRGDNDQNHSSSAAGTGAPGNEGAARRRGLLSHRGFGRTAGGCSSGTARDRDTTYPTRRVSSWTATGASGVGAGERARVGPGFCGAAALRAKAREGVEVRVGAWAAAAAAAERRWASGRAARDADEASDSSCSSNDGNVELGGGAMRGAASKGRAPASAGSAKCAAGAGARARCGISAIFCGGSKCTDGTAREQRESPAAKAANGKVDDAATRPELQADWDRRGHARDTDVADALTGWSQGSDAAMETSAGGGSVKT